MPLIRFDIGDYATRGNGQCKCGRASPYLTNIIGRETEFLQLRDGSRLSPYRLTTAVETVPGLLKYRFFQADDLSLRIEVVLGGSEISMEAQIEQIRRNLRPILSDELDMPVCVVDEISRTDGGKHSIVSRSAK